VNKAALRRLRKAIEKEKNPREKARLIYELLGVGEVKPKKRPVRHHCAPSFELKEFRNGRWVKVKR